MLALGGGEEPSPSGYGRAGNAAPKSKVDVPAARKKKSGAKGVATK
jgi:hypothetical protein